MINRSVQVLRGKLKQSRIISEMPKSAIAVVAKKPTNLSCPVVMVYNQGFFCAADNTLMRGSFKFFKRLIRDDGSKLATVDATSVCCSACSAPAIQPVPFFVVRREEVCGSGLFSLAAGTG